MTTATTEAVELLAGAVVPLTLHDRCDASASGVEQAFVRVTVASGSEFLLCAHHYNEHEATIAALNDVQIQDERDRINLKPNEHITHIDTGED